ncbi:hypothetical protein [Allorhodopirellula solitaria]|uniref:Uncharacterized protein n=1 Tax=Allorhodopirellula solitaria TaxID=2527987 RepID=A0A5C5XTX2_9BACT|nr:hypothetical protein [Allorhodopirellula solitaria]TWT66158.1 hypothetical protein CA85_30220 [Allorhodopirellula solitaria]
MSRTVEACATYELESEILEAIGQPDESEVLTIPVKSGWGLQEALRYKVHPGERVQQWLYHGTDQDLCVWFAEVANTWRVTLVLSVPSNVARKIH